MKTDELISLLAKDAGPVAPGATAKRFTKAMSSSVLFTLFAMILMFGVRPDIGAAIALPIFWVKLVFPALVAVVMLYATIHLARPGMKLVHAPGMLAILFAAIWISAGIVLAAAAPAERAELIFGDTWLYCVVIVPLLSIPSFAAAIWALKGLAPTRLRLAGAVAGLLAGSVSAAAYALHCPELSLPFLAIWYVIGMLIPAIAGAFFGPRLLHW